MIARPHAGLVEHHRLRRGGEVQAVGSGKAIDPPRPLEVQRALAILEVGIRVLFTLRSDLVFVHQINRELQRFFVFWAVHDDLFVVFADELAAILVNPAVPHAERLHVDRGEAHTKLAAIIFGQLLRPIQECFLVGWRFFRVEARRLHQIDIHIHADGVNVQRNTI